MDGSMMAQAAIHASQAAGVSRTFPSLRAAGMPIDARQFVTPGTRLHVAIAYSVTVVLGVVAAAATAGVVLLVIVLGWLVDLVLRRRVMAMLRGSCVEVGPEQLPAVYACVKTYAERVGLPEVPRVFVVEGNSVNAFAMRLGSRSVITLVDDVVWGALESGNHRALSFVIAHEVAHHALGHTNHLRRVLALAYKVLSRLDELSADAVALQLVGDRQAACDGLMMLMIGPQLMPFINREQLLAQAASVHADKQTKRAERPFTHPFLARRIHVLNQLALASRG